MAKDDTGNGPASKDRQYYPIIYVRGYAFRPRDVEETVDDPFYGFNIGSTHSHPNSNGKAIFYGFESQLIRLMKDWGYRDAYVEGKQGSIKNELWRNQTVWIFRYYDPTSGTFTNANKERLTIEQAAAELAKEIDRVLDETNSQKVILIAHSMGGLICRSLIQKFYVENLINPRQKIDKLLTFGTPHGGIYFTNNEVLDRLKNYFTLRDADNFNKDRMYRFLLPSKDQGRRVRAAFDPRQMTKWRPPGSKSQNSDPIEVFPVDRILCVIGTNAMDYTALNGWSSSTVGPESDGLVLIECAYVGGAHRAYIHRSHSGRYGMVNSEEGYENLQRFLFGDMKIKIVLQGSKLPVDKNNSKAFHIEVRSSIRGLTVFTNERTLNHYSAIAMTNDVSYLLATLFLISEQPHQQVSRFSLGLAVHCLIQTPEGQLDVTDYMEQVPEWQDYLIVELGPSTPSYSLNHKWLSDSRQVMEPASFNSVNSDSEETPVERIVPLPAKAGAILGSDAHLKIEISKWW